jgi:hypothetical protein
MKPVNNKVILSCDQFQKDSILIGDSVFRTANAFETNYRYRAPTIATVVEGNEYVKQGDILLCHHNLFYLPSPYFLYNDLFSIPFSKVLFAKINPDGSLEPICGNILGDKIDIQTYLPLPIEQRKKYADRIVVTKSSDSNYKSGQIILARPSACYDIIYMFNGEERSATKISNDMVCGVVVANE